MKVSKHIMNPARRKQLEVIADTDEANHLLVANRSHSRFEQVKLSVQRFAELGFIQFTGGGTFTITEKGQAYLEEIKN